MKISSRILGLIIICLGILFVSFNYINKENDSNLNEIKFTNYNELYGIPLEKSSPLAYIDGKTAGKQNLKNLAILIKFSDSDVNVVHHIDDTESISNAQKIYNSDYFEMNTEKGLMKVPSFKTYFEKQSYGKLSLTTELLPKINGNVIAYKDKHPIGYYLRYSEVNQLGYKNSQESLQRETELVNNAILYVANNSLLNISASEIDAQGDGFVDAISFIVEGQKNLPVGIRWGELLWSHMLNNTGVTATILGKKVKAYNLLYAGDYTESANLFSLNRGTYGTIIHEFGHMLGYRDLYRHDYVGNPVGFYDIMANTIGSNPQNFLTYYISEFDTAMNFHKALPVINKTKKNITLYKPEFVDDNELRAVTVSNTIISMPRRL
ncbi:MAG: immune inhibitor A, partial [Bacilli bacterium]|nr:immune inhibitor A [Bacilli bacterium]